MKKLALVALMLSMVMVAVVVLRPTDRSVAQGNAIFVSMTPPNEIRQGRTAILRVNGSGLVNVNASFNGKRIELYKTNLGDWAGFLAVDMNDTVGGYTLDIYYWTEADTVPQVSSQQINVLYGTFEYQDIPIPFELEPLLDPELNAFDFGTISQIQRRASNEIFFTDFAQPVPGPVISGFGQIRNYNNGALEGRHTGIDYPATQGTAVTAVANGRVIFADFLPIHGNHVMIDHGWGIVSGYSHLSEISVVPGELLRQGQIIGLSGATGRVQGPHLHFEISVNGSWVDAQQFFDLEVPLVAVN